MKRIALLLVVVLTAGTLVACNKTQEPTPAIEVIPTAVIDTNVVATVAAPVDEAAALTEVATTLTPWLTSVTDAVSTLTTQITSLTSDPALITDSTWRDATTAAVAALRSGGEEAKVVAADLATKGQLPDIGTNLAERAAELSSLADSFDTALASESAEEITPLTEKLMGAADNLSVLSQMLAGGQ